MARLYSLRLFLQGSAHPWHKGRPGEVGGSASEGSRSAPGKPEEDSKELPSEALSDAIKAAGEMMGSVKGRGEEGYQDAYLALKKASTMAAKEGKPNMSTMLMKKAMKYKDWAEKFKK